MNPVNTIFVMWVTNAALASLCFVPTSTRFLAAVVTAFPPMCTALTPGDPQAVSPWLCPQLPPEHIPGAPGSPPWALWGDAQGGESVSSGLTLAPLERLQPNPNIPILVIIYDLQLLRREHPGLTKRLYLSGLQVLYWQVCNCKQLRGIMETPG